MTKSEFPWQALKVICEGISIVDIPKLELSSEAEAHQFLMTYGYDLFDANHRDQVWAFYDEAVQFVGETLKITIPPSLKDRVAIADFRNLLLVASGRPGYPQSSHQVEVCAILRVMHVLSHVKNDLRLKYLSKVRKQTIGRLDAHVQKKIENGKEVLFLGFENQKVPLVRFESKTGKNRNSVLMKLLQKPANVAQEVYDHLGVRFVTRTRSDSILVVKYLIDHHLISVANVISARCRNTLVSLSDFQNLIQSADLNQPGFFDGIDSKLGFPTNSFGADNPFSSADYHSLQFTCRPLIRIPVIRKGVRAEVSFFFPLEIQIMDELSYSRNQVGDAKHSNYKLKQLEAVRARVIGEHL